MTTTTPRKRYRRRLDPLNERQLAMMRSIYEHSDHTHHLQETQGAEKTLASLEKRGLAERNGKRTNLTADGRDALFAHEH